MRLVRMCGGAQWHVRQLKYVPPGDWGRPRPEHGLIVYPFGFAFVWRASHQHPDLPTDQHTAAASGSTSNLPAPKVRETFPAQGDGVPAWAVAPWDDDTAEYRRIRNGEEMPD